MAITMKSAELVKEASRPPTRISNRRWILNCSRGLCDSATTDPPIPSAGVPPLLVVPAFGVAIEPHGGPYDVVDAGRGPQQEEHDQQHRAGAQPVVEQPANQAAPHQSRRQLDRQPEDPTGGRLRNTTCARPVAALLLHLVAQGMQALGEIL